MLKKNGSRVESTTEVANSRGALAGLSLAMMLSSLGTSIANVALPTLTKAFDTSFQGAQWIVLSYLLTTTVLIVGVGRLGDLIGRRRLLIAGISLFIAGSILCAFAPFLWLLISARVIQAIGAATMMSLTIAIVGDITPPEKIGSAMGLLGTTSAIGTALGPTLGGLLISEFSWRAIFLVNLPLGGIALLLSHRFLPGDTRGEPSAHHDFDCMGTLLLAITLGAYSLAMTIGRGAFGWFNGGLLILAVLSMGSFIQRETKATSPLIPLEAFRIKGLRMALGLNVLVSTVLMATLVIGPFYLSRALGLDTSQVGFVMSIGPLVAALTGVPAGRMVDSRGANHMTRIGVIGLTVGCAVFSITPAAFGIPGYLAPITIITASYALFQAANNASVMTGIRAEQRGMISGLLSLSRNLGLITGASAMGALFSMAVGTGDIQSALPGAVSIGLRITFGVTTAVMLSVVAAVFAVRVSPDLRRT